MQENADKNIDKAVVKATEDYIRQLIAQMRSNPSPELLVALRAVLGTQGLDKDLIAEAERVMQEAGQKLSGSSMAALGEIDALGLDAKQMKLVSEFYVSLSDLKDGVKKYKEVFAEFEVKTKKKGKELDALNTIITADPISPQADEARVSRDVVILDMINLYDPLSKQEAICVARLKECNIKIMAIEKDETLTDKQSKALKNLAEMELQAVERELREPRGKVSKYDRELSEHLEKALCDKVAAELSSTTGEYKQIIQKDLLPEEKSKISDFIQSIKAKPVEERHTTYQDFTKEFIEEKMKALNAIVTGGANEPVAQAENQDTKIKGHEVQADKNLENDPFSAIIAEAQDKKKSFRESVKEQNEQKKDHSHNR